MVIHPDTCRPSYELRVPGYTAEIKLQGGQWHWNLTTQDGTNTVSVEKGVAESPQLAEIGADAALRELTVGDVTFMQPSAKIIQLDCFKIIFSPEGDRWTWSIYADIPVDHCKSFTWLRDGDTWRYKLVARSMSLGHTFYITGGTCFVLYLAEFCADTLLKTLTNRELSLAF